MTTRTFVAVAACVFSLVQTSVFGAEAGSAPPAPQPPTVDANGTLQVSSFSLPYSALASPQAKAALIEELHNPVIALMGNPDIQAVRKAMDEKFFGPLIAKQYARYPVTMSTETIGGVYTQIFVPKAGIAPKNKNRVLINLHGGGFTIGARSESQLESIPIAAVGRIKVISVDYRMGPEHQFPAASEDVAAVYKALLSTHKASDIGIFGCSAGGMLTAEAVAWFQKVRLPKPGAVGIFCASTNRFGVGDSAYVSFSIGGTIPPPPPGDNNGFGPRDAYFRDARTDDPLVVPSASVAVLAKFPPTLIITGTRASELSAAAHSHVELVKAGVDARLFVWEAMDHGFFGNPDLPESREAYDVIVGFFEKQLGKITTR